MILNVGGNKYRIVGLVAFRSKRIYVLFVGTHAQYDATDVNKL
ncbi:type II toxin-antitoxin system HigB family toxin [Rhizobium tibeticum]|nr:type II toxin-antitoxin system HigB family toxin [Rhizobium tibeticum]